MLALVTTVLTPIPDTDFDLTEVTVSWQVLRARAHRRVQAQEVAGSPIRVAVLAPIAWRPPPRDYGSWQQFARPSRADRAYGRPELASQRTRKGCATPSKYRSNHQI
jgi:hypothetical protein